MEGGFDIKQSESKENIPNTPAWIDEEDEKIKISLNQKNNLKKLKKEKGEDLISGTDFQERLREQFTKMNHQADIYKWAMGNEDGEQSETLTGTTEENSLDNLLKTNKNVIKEAESFGEGDIKNAYSSILKIKQIPDLNKDNFHSSIISAISFHPVKDTLAFTSGLDKKLKLFSINEVDDTSSNIQTINTIDMPIFASKFLNEKEILMSGKRKTYFSYNLEANKLEKCPGLFAHKEINSLEKMFVGDSQYAFGTNEGYILIFDAKSKTYRYDIKISGSVNSVCFDRNGINLYTVGDQSEIYIFDLRKYRNCLNKFSDSGNFNTNCMDLSKDNSYLATASNSGIVNLYSVDQIHNNHSANIEPIKTVENLTTSCEFLKFNNMSNKLGFCSRWKKHAFKILNLNNMKVYSNFPTYSSRIKYPLCFDFSINEKYLAIGNDEGRALLYKI